MILSGLQTQISRKTVAPISVLIPAHNAEDFISEALQSVVKQTLPVIEIIVIADDCTDRSTQIARELGARVVEQKRRNMAAALNLGITLSTQPWIAFLDADDFWDKQKIARQWKAIDMCPYVDLVACDSYSVMNNEVVEVHRDTKKRWRKISRRISTETCQYVSEIDGEFFKNFYLQTSRVVLRREAALRVGLLDERFKYWQTIEFFARVLRDSPLAYVEEPLIYQRLHNSSHTRNVAGYWSAYIDMINLMLKKPSLYPAGAGMAYRECLKDDFYSVERELARMAV